ncbi:MAG TPA: hypothetical protein VGQ76_17755 [Thermoanaerobaculia bacterium]|jgi:hypothetical protein|nr:hypothetical protein [Thermoanaerobaculia bacterium]
MRTHGSDRARRIGDRVILLSAIIKGWTPRTPKTQAHSEHPGTTVQWDDELFEVVEATVLPSGGVQYVLMAWSESHTIRTLEHYDEASEALRIADHERARKQQRASLGARFAGLFLGFLPASVQNHLQDELGVRATRMTLLSCLLSLVAFGICAYAFIDAKMRGDQSPVPFLVWPIVMFLFLEALMRFFVAMSQGRPMGSALGVIGYAIYHAFSRKPTIVRRGESVAFTAPTDDVALRDSLEVKEPLLTLLTPDEQKKLAKRFGYDYRHHAFIVAWVILVFALLGAFASTSVLSMLIAGAVAAEQAVRLSRLRREPAGSVFAALVRPLVRDLLR